MMKSMKCPTPYRKTPGKPRPVSREGKDSVKVYCRVKPLMNDNDTACLRVLSATTVQLISPEGATNRIFMYKEIQFTFNEVFCDADSQKKVFDNAALPLVENLIQGKNSLLFTYGVTGSGKTYTMTGEPENGGIMPRCIDVIFNTIAGYQAKKYVFKPDKMNGFDVQSEPEAKLERANSLKSLYTPKTPFKTPKKKDTSSEINRVADTDKVSGIDEDSTYAVFVTFIEIYNNYVYDLLENIPDERMGKGMQNRLIRSDSKSNMYVHGITELEVTTPQEAFEAFNKGQKRKRMAHTNLNSESSRSHMVFTIRLVQGPLDSNGESALCDKKAVTVSQLSLVDLAGSERTNRTQNTGQRLREAGNINNSLMTLRTCLEILRENQLYGTNKMVPYRDARITHLFKNFFEGEGQVRVIVCVNPRTDDYDETIHVMKFAEMTQEVQTTKPPIMEKPNLDLLPGRRKANQILREANRRLEAKVGDGSGDTDIGLVYSLGPPFPALEMTVEDSEKIIHDLLSVLEARMKRRVELTREVHKKQESFRAHLAEIQNEQVFSRVENSSLKASLENEKQRSTLLENQVIKLQNRVSELERDVVERENNVKFLSQDVRQLQLELNQKKFDKEKLKLKCSNAIAAEKEKMTKECQQRLRDKEDELKTEMYLRDEKLRKMQEVLSERYPNGRDIPSSVAVMSPLQPHLPSSCVAASNGVCELHLPSVGVLNGAGKFSQTGVSRPGSVTTTPYRSRRSSCSDMWIDHRSAMPTQLGTVLQPKMKKRKSVTKLTDVADIADPKVSKYCLMTQEQDSGGELETRLYKADVFPTTGGGAQIVFNDMETLKQRSPLSPMRKRNAVGDAMDTPAACSISIEGHGKKPRV